MRGERSECAEHARLDQLRAGQAPVQRREIVARIVRIQVVLSVIVEVQVVEEHTVEPVRGVRAHVGSLRVIAAGGMLRDSAQLAEEEAEGRGQSERERGEPKTGAATRDDHQDGELDRRQRKDLAAAGGGREIAWPQDALGEGMTKIEAEQRPQQVPSECGARRALQPEVMKALRIARSTIKPVV